MIQLLVLTALAAPSLPLLTANEQTRLLTGEVVVRHDLEGQRMGSLGMALVRTEPEVAWHSISTRG